MENHIEMIARLREEKKMLLDVISRVENWAFGEGYLITPTLRVKLEMAKKAAEHIGDTVALEDIPFERQPEKETPRQRTYNISPENRAAASQRKKDYWAKIRAQGN